jgi:WD40-like Beta Propeller Repeat
VSSGKRRALFVLLVAACSLGAVAVVLASAGSGDPAGRASAGARDALPSARAAGRPSVVYATAGGDAAAGGQVAVAPLAEPARGTLLPLRCDRVHFAAGTGICLARGSGFAAGYEARIFGPDLRVRDEVEVAGIPSRARVSPDGRYGSVTLFVTGHSYAAAGEFSTETTLIDLRRGERIAELEDFTVTRDGEQVTAVDANFWGVTFARDSDRFYATMATGGKTYLVQGSVAQRVAHVLHENVECPSLSPDGTRLAYKRRTGSDEQLWRLTVLDLDTMRETPLAEPRSVDDQAEWLDDDRVLYGIEGEIDVVRADGSGRPSRFAAGAGSPAVVRW